MPYEPIVNTSVTQQTTSVTKQGFGALLFIDAHNQFIERYREYNSITAVEADFPTYSEAWKAASGYFAQEPKPKSIIIGRRKTGAVLTPTTPVTGMVYNVTLTVDGGTTSVFTYTAVDGDSANAVAVALAAAINGVTAIAAKVTAVGSSGVLSITQDSGTAEMAITALGNLTVAPIAATETAANALAAIQAATTSFYAITAHDRSDAFIEAMIDAVDPTKNTYWFSTTNAAAYGTNSPTASDVFAVAKREGHPRAIGIYHHDASKYAEVRYFAINATYQPGDVIYMNHTVVGLEAGKNALGNLLTATEKSNLHSRGLNYIDMNFGLATVRDGLTLAAGENTWIDNQIGADLIEARCNEATFRTLINQNGSKIGMSSAGMGAIASMLATVLDGMKSTSGTARLLYDYEIITPTDAELTKEVRASRRVFITVRAYLESAVQYVDIAVTLTYPGA